MQIFTDDSSTVDKCVIPFVIFTLRLRVMYEAHYKLWYVRTALYEAFALNAHMRARVSLL